MRDIEKLKVVIVMPAYNAAKTVKNTFEEIPPYLRKHIILVDDNSTDNTVKVAKNLGLQVIKHPKNLGYGGNQKTCYKKALELNADIVVMLHPDYQYDASMIEDLIYPIARGRYDFMFGSRIANKKGALLGGMPPLKYYVNRIVCLIENILLGVNFSEHFSGFRAYSKKFLETVPWQNFSDDFVFDQEMTIAALDYEFKVGEIAIPTRYHKKASSIRFLKGSKFVLEGFFVIAALYLNRWGLKKDERFRKVSSQNPAKLFFFLAIILLNLFLYGIFQLNIIFGFLLFIESILLYVCLTKSTLTAKLAGLTILFFLIIFSLNNNFDKTFYNPTSLEKFNQPLRQEYFATELGKIYRNRVGLTYTNHILPASSKFTKNMFSHLSLASLLNANSVFALIFVPLFFLGIFEIAKKLNKFLVFYLASVLLVGGLLTFEGQYGFLLFSPVVNLIIFLGLLNWTSNFKLLK